MNQERLNTICALLNLGAPVGEPQKVTGGLLHDTWKVQTSTGTYAIKKINHTEPLDAKTRQHYETTEQVAKIFKRYGVSSSICITNNERSLVDVADDSYLVFPWIEARALASNAISSVHAIKIAQLLATMHSVQLQMPDMAEPGFELHTNDSIKELVQQSIEQNMPYASQLSEQLSSLLELNNNYHDAIPLLCKTLIVGHRDLDQKNILWDSNDDPIVIDWESAALLNPTQEIVTAALDWSWIHTTINIDVFEAMIKKYVESGGHIDDVIIEPALYGVLGNMLNWLAFNIKKSMNKDLTNDDRAMGTEQVNKTLHTMHYLYTQIDSLKSRIQNVIKS